MNLEQHFDDVEVVLLHRPIDGSFVLLVAMETGELSAREDSPRRQTDRQTGCNRPIAGSPDASRHCQATPYEDIIQRSLAVYGISSF